MPFAVLTYPKSLVGEGRGDSIDEGVMGGGALLLTLELGFAIVTRRLGFGLECEGVRKTAISQRVMSVSSLAPCPMVAKISSAFRSVISLMGPGGNYCISRAMQPATNGKLSTTTSTTTTTSITYTATTTTTTSTYNYNCCFCIES